MWQVCSANPKKRQGFTLVELLISMSIFSVISGFVLVNFRAGSRKDELRLAADQVTVIVRDALARATAGARVGVCVANAVAVVVPPGTALCTNGGVLVEQVPPGWGVRFGIGTPNDIGLFADLNNNQLFDSGESYTTEAFSESGFVQAAAATPNGQETVVVFSLPNPDVHINADPMQTDATLSLTHVVDGGSRTIHINRVSRRVTVTTP
jgi:prepilin-type N-terminal cleavage/methylation domain-containing protein